MKILSFGAGMQSTALALMACENAMNDPAPYPMVPVYDAVIFCDLGLEPLWVHTQMEFTRKACEAAGIFFKVLDTPLYQDFVENFGERRTISIPWWTLRKDGHKSKMPRYCTLDYKVETISKYVRWELIGYRKGQRLRLEDVKAHEMHMGFSFEEKHRCKENPNRMFVNKYPLVDMQLVRADNYRYILEHWIPRQVPVRSVRSIAIIFSNTSGITNPVHTEPCLTLIIFFVTRTRSHLWIPTCSLAGVGSASRI